jgi:MFS superfamily sulfate permease-like transporter
VDRVDGAVPGRAPGTPGRPLRDRLRRRAGGDYDRSDLAHDVGAGLLLTALLIPAGMGYATAAGLPPETGLYATVASLVAYALVGPSRVLVLGPDSSLAPLIAAAVAPLAAAGSVGADRRVALAGLLAVLVGAVLVAGGLARLGFVSELLSKPIRVGYLNGVVLVVIVGQLPARPRCDGWRSPPSRSPTSTRRPRRCSSGSTTSCRAGASAWSSPR